MSHFQNLIDGLKAKKEGKQYKACCPAHDDSNPSLSITEKNGKVLVKCHAGCSQEEVIEKLRYLKLWPQKENFIKIPAFRISKEYFYQNKKAENHLKILRKENGITKKFFQMFFNGQDWQSGGAKEEVLPYKYKDWKENDLIFFVEGEKACEALWEIGQPATTTPMGAGKWKSEYRSYFRNKKIVLWPDNDEVGIRHIFDVAKDIESLVKSLCIIDPTLFSQEGYDAFDWTYEGKSLSDLESLTKSTLSFKKFSDKFQDVVKEKKQSMVISIDAVQEWNDPIEFDIDEVPSIDPALLPEPLCTFAVSVSEALEVPLEFVISMILGAVSTCTTGRFSILVKEGYVEPLNLFIISAMESGNRKSPTLEVCYSPIRKWEQEKHEEFEPIIKKSKADKKNQEAEIKNLRNQLGKDKTGKGDQNNISTEALIQRIVNIENDIKPIPIAPRLLVADATPEAVGKLLINHDERLSIVSDEGGFFDTIGGRYNKGIANLDLILKSYSGTGTSIDRVGEDQALILKNPLMSICISPQPSVIQKFVKYPEFRSKGLIARFLMTIPPSVLGSRTGEVKPISKEVQNKYNFLLQDILNYPIEKNSFGQQVQVSEDAYSLWNVFWNETEKKMRSGKPFEFVKDWAGKFPGNIARIAGNLHVCEYVKFDPIKNPLTKETMLRAVCVGEALEKHALKTFLLMNANPHIVDANAIKSWIKRKNITEFRRRDCHHAFKSRLTRVKDLVPVLDLLEENEFIRKKESELVPHRPSEEYEVNPKVLL